MIYYTDGSANTNSRKGGCAFIIVDKDKIIYEWSNKYEDTTNNKMELKAIIKSIRYAIKNKDNNCKIFSDSQYCIKGITEWIVKWRLTNYNNILNSGLWKTLDKLQHKYYDKFEVKIEFNHVKGHSGDKYNDIVDKLASYKL